MKKMFRSNSILYLSILLLIFQFVAIPAFSNSLIVLMLIAVWSDKNSIEKFKVLYRSKLFLVLISLYVIFFAAVFYSNDTNEALRIIQLRLPLLIFPIVYGLHPMNARQVYIILMVLIGLVCVIPIIGIGTQWGKYIETGDSGWFYNDNIVKYVDKQAVYFAMYVNFALLGLFHLWYNKKLKHTLLKVGAIAAFVFLLIDQYLLASRTSILTMVLLIGTMIVVLIAKKMNRKQALGLLIVLSFLVVGLVVLFPKVLKRFDSISHTEFQFDNKNPINHFNGEIKKENWNGLNTRLALWTCAIDEIKKRPLFGTGLGDVQNELDRNYIEKNFVLAIKRRYNCHNQYLDLLLSNGMVGFVVFLFLIIYLIVKAIKEKSGLLLGLTIIFALASITENTLSRNQGVLLISLLISIVAFKIDSDENVNEISELKTKLKTPKNGVL